MNSRKQFKLLNRTTAVTRISHQDRIEEICGNTQIIIIKIMEL